MTSLYDLPKDILIKLLTTIEKDLNDEHNKKIHNLATLMTNYSITGDNVIWDKCCEKNCEALTIKANDGTNKILYISKDKYFVNCYHCPDYDRIVYCSNHCDKFQEHFEQMHKKY